jgi:hypothetical protein
MASPFSRNIILPKRQLIMTYLDPKRLAKIEAFQRQLIGDRLEPYYSQLQRGDLSPNQLLEIYHDYYYRRYHQSHKNRRCRNFLDQCKKIMDENMLNSGIYIVRTVVLEGLIVEPDAAELKRLQRLWNYLINDVGDDKLFNLVSRRYFSILRLYYDDLEENPIPYTIHYRQAMVTEKLIDYRNQIAQRSLEGYGNQPLAPLWEWVMLFDQEEAEHLASLSDSDYYASDYWREFSQYYQQQHGDRCPFCGGQGPLFLYNPHREYHGQEFFLPQVVTCRCQQCADQ